MFILYLSCISLFAIPQMSLLASKWVHSFWMLLNVHQGTLGGPLRAKHKPNWQPMPFVRTQGTDYLCKKIPKTPLDFLPYRLFSSGRIRVFINFLHSPRSVLLLLNVCARTCVASSSFLMKSIWGKNTSAPWKWFVIVLSGLLDLQTSQSAHLGCY